MDAQCGYMVEPDMDLYKFQSGPTSADPRGISDANYTRYKDSVLDELYVKQGRAIDLEERKKYVREFEKRLLDEEAHTMYTLQWHRIIPHNSRVKGWTVTPSHYLNNQLDTLWLTAWSYQEALPPRPGGEMAYSPPVPAPAFYPRRAARP